jgi:hypothetical protein
MQTGKSLKKKVEEEVGLVLDARNQPKRAER